ncbi:hypothetical protein [Spelaeicoccus albus]|uniref:Uncharacterized protein n=1 Tax=Spelaeicoccus albus TaxID=1280376 RepID=A0A7Z0D5M6_9MICO|nr:hypothetical protein [Spelaeicoccus albus]
MTERTVPTTGMAQVWKISSILAYFLAIGLSVQMAADFRDENFA